MAINDLGGGGAEEIEEKKSKIVCFSTWQFIKWSEGLWGNFVKIRVMPSSSMQTISWSTRLGDLPPFGESKGSDINYGKGGAITNSVLNSSSFP